jgi:mobilization protein NikA
VVIQVRNNAREVSCYLSIEEAARFKDAASACKISLSRYLRQCLLDYERLSDNDTRAPSGFALIEMEQRLARSIEVQSRRLNSLYHELHLLFAMVDRLAFVSLVHLPEIPVELRESALTAGTRLYNNWRNAVMELTESGTETDSLSAQPTEDAANGRHNQQENDHGLGSNSIDAAR